MKEDWKAKLESVYSFMLEYSKMTVWVEKQTRRVLGFFSILLAWLVEDVMLILHHSMGTFNEDVRY